MKIHACALPTQSQLNTPDKHYDYADSFETQLDGASQQRSIKEIEGLFYEATKWVEGFIPQPIFDIKNYALGDSSSIRNMKSTTQQAI